MPALSLWELCPRPSKAPLSAQADRRGFFHLAGLPAGRYRLWAEAEGERSLPVMVVVDEGVESHLPTSLELLSPVKAAFFCQPPRDPQEGRWKVELWDSDPARATGERVAEGTSDPGGTVELPRGLPSDYLVMVSSSAGEVVYAAFERVD